MKIFVAFSQKLDFVLVAIFKALPSLQVRLNSSRQIGCEKVDFEKNDEACSGDVRRVDVVVVSVAVIAVVDAEVDFGTERGQARHCQTRKGRWQGRNLISPKVALK